MAPRPTATEDGDGQSTKRTRAIRKGTAALAKRQVRPFSPAGFDEAFVDLGADAADCPEPPVDEVMPSMAGCEILGPPPTL